MENGLPEHKKTWGAEAPHVPRFSRNASDYDLHEMAGGLPLQTITAPNIRRLSKQGREVCKQERKLTSRNKKCGSKKTRYAPSRKIILLPLLRKENPSEYRGQLPALPRLR